MNIRTPYILTGAALILLIAGAAWQYNKKQTASTETGETGTSTVLTIDPNATSTTVGGYTIERETAVQMPDYKTAIPIKTDLADDARAAIKAQQADIRVKLDADNKDFNTWMRLAVLHKMAGNLDRAIEIWKFVTIIWPTDVVAYRNLGGAYHTLGNTKESRAWYQKGIDLATEQGNAALAAQLRAESGIK
jgi:tetratricopeptide (TPR) repeat protein